MKQELKPCPFCDGKATLIKHINYYVQCEDCLASTSISYYKDVAINAWNTRSEHSNDITEMVKCDLFTTNVSKSQMRYALLKIILAKFDAEDFKSTTKREYIDCQSWQNKQCDSLQKFDIWK